MSKHSLAAELQRVQNRPKEPKNILLCVFTVTPVTSIDEYSRRLREVIQKAVEIAATRDFDTDDIDVGPLPDWFKKATQSEHQGIPRAVLEGKQRYSIFRGEEPWGSEEWIYAFDPEVRTWSWWDITTDRNNQTFVWVDTGGEAHVPCEELRWALYVSGAAEVHAMTSEYSDVWREQESVGLPA